MKRTKYGRCLHGGAPLRKSGYCEWHLEEMGPCFMRAGTRLKPKHGRGSK